MFGCSSCTHTLPAVQRRESVCFFCLKTEYRLLGKGGERTSWPDAVTCQEKLLWMWCSRRDLAAIASPVGWCGLASGAVFAVYMLARPSHGPSSYLFWPNLRAGFFRVLFACPCATLSYLGRGTSIKIALFRVPPQERILQNGNYLACLQLCVALASG